MKDDEDYREYKEMMKAAKIKPCSYKKFIKVRELLYGLDWKKWKLEVRRINQPK